jgi:bacillithiol biosynthesis cysteine-adding enzyme BshC
MNEPECLPFSAIPHISRLFADYTSDFQRVAPFFPRPPQYASWLADEAKKLATFDPKRRQSVADILEKQNQSWGASPETLKNISRLRSGANAVVTGQQVIFLGGPLYSLFKALTAIKIAAQASRDGHDSVPIFWLATEDHDFEEVRNTTLRSAKGELRTFSLPPTISEAAPVTAIRLGAEVTPIVQEAASLLGAGQAAQWLQQSYAAGQTLGSAFARFFSRIFADHGLILLDPTHPVLHQLCQPIYRSALEGSEAISDALLRRNQELEAAGYHAQVKVTTTLLFALRDGRRVPVKRSNGRFTVEEEKFSPPELLQKLSAHPEDFSPNVLLRPVVQDFLLPTLAYIGGPSEIAYFAQAGIVYEKLLGRVTPILPRLSATLSDARAQRLLQRYQVSLSEVFRGPDHLRELLAARGLPADLDASLAQAEENLEKSLAAVTEALVRLDPTLGDAAQHAGSKMRYQLEQLRGRAARARLRRHEELARHAGQLSAALYPNQDLQERGIAGVSFMAQFGRELLTRLYDAIPSTCAGHQIINIG